MSGKCTWPLVLLWGEDSQWFGAESYSLKFVSLRDGQGESFSLASPCKHMVIPVSLVHRDSLSGFTALKNDKSRRVADLNQSRSSFFSSVGDKVDEDAFSSLFSDGLLNDAPLLLLSIFSPSSVCEDDDCRSYELLSLHDKGMDQSSQPIEHSNKKTHPHIPDGSSAHSSLKHPADGSFSKFPHSSRAQPNDQHLPHVWPAGCPVVFSIPPM